MSEPKKEQKTKPVEEPKSQELDEKDLGNISAGAGINTNGPLNMRTPKLPS